MQDGSIPPLLLIELADIFSLIISRLNMTLQQLQYVVALDTQKHFVKAAESCFVTQPTLTLQLKKLEDEISTVLFNRSVQPLEPTPMGKIFILKARRILKEVQELKDLVNDDRNQLEGEYRLGIIPTLAPSLLPLFIADFMQKHANTKLVVEELQSEEILNQLETRQLDLGLMATPTLEAHVREIPLFYEPFLVYTDPSNALLRRKTISADMLKPEGLWVLRQGHCFRNHTLNICEFDASGHHRGLEMEGGSIETLKKMVLEVSGYTLIPELSYDEQQEEAYVRRFAEPQPVREISLVVHEHFTKERLINELRKSILDNTPDSFQKNAKFKTVKWR
ncbi:MAG TPA: LysR family transcriptional regulator [Cytophagales bacterium]|nr:LysR family transcriptional regulator [Cytophagales bacterium]HAA22182.1 LysR family transcriptional regulator [Cytophagales bacterium]HAP65061.1 LysR family transcriptional regulator [Cytophagales bacterium]